MSPFLHPGIAWAALGLASIPIIIHLLNRRRLRQIDWAAMEFLLAALRKNKRRVRIEQLILLACRVLLMLLIAFFLARPLLDNTRFGWLAGALQSEDKIFVVDDSLSAGQVEADRSVLKRSTDALTSALAKMADASSRDRITILRTSQVSAPVSRGATLDRDRAARLEETLASLSVTSTRAGLASAIDGITDLLAQSSAEDGGRPRSIAVLTDLRASDWTDASGGADPGLQVAFERLLAQREEPPRILLLDVGTSNVANVSVADLSIAGGRPSVGIPAEVRVEVRNWGSQPISDLRVRIEYGLAGATTEGGADDDPAGTNMALAPPIATIPAGGSETVSVPCTFRSPGQYQVEAEVTGGGDSLREDNRLGFVVDVVEATEVLIVSGEPSSDPFLGETDYLQAALRPTGEASSGLAPTVVIEDNLPRGDLSKYGAIFLANVYHLPEDFLVRLGRYVREGGPLVIFLGDQIDPVVYERDLGTAAGSPDESHPQRGLLPANLGEVIELRDTPVGFAPSYEHRFFAFLKDGGERYVQEASFASYFELKPLPTTRVLATFEDAGSRPALVTAAVDAGSVYLFASSADTEWNDWPRSVTFLPILQEMMRSIGQTRSHEPIHLAGAPIEIPIDITEFDARGSKYRGPDYPRTPERDLIASAPPGDPTNFRLRIADTLHAGLSSIQMKRRTGEAEVRGISIRSEAVESDLRRISGERLAELYPDVPLTFVRDPSQFSETGRGRFEIADVLLALLFVLLLVEGVLAWWFAHHRRAGADRHLELSRPSRRGQTV